MHVALVRDRHADLADLAAGQLVVGVVAGLGGQVEGDRQAGLALGQVARGTARWTPSPSNGPRRCASSTAGRARAGGARSSARIVWSGRLVLRAAHRPCAPPRASRARRARPRPARAATALVPPRRLQFVGRERLRRDRRRVPGHFVELGRPDSPASGSSTSAAASAGWRARWPATCGASGSYDGFDVNGDGDRRGAARDATGAIRTSASRSPTSINAALPPDGAHRAGEYRFPYDDASFDFAIASACHAPLPRPSDGLTDVHPRVGAGRRALANPSLLSDGRFRTTRTGGRAGAGRRRDVPRRRRRLRADHPGAAARTDSHEARSAREDEGSRRAGASSPRTCARRPGRRGDAARTSGRARS